MTTQTAAAPIPQPPRWSKDVLLRDGTSLRLRPVRPDDDERMLAFFSRLSPESLYRRFMSVVARVDLEQVRRFTHIDYTQEMAIAGVVPDEQDPGVERIIAVGRFVRLPNPAHAEVAFEVEDAYQGQGIGTHLLQELLPFARMAEVEVLEADVLADNRDMLSVFQNMGFTITSSRQEGVVHIEFAFEETELSQERRWTRERNARIASLGRLFRPRSVAIVGASPKKDTIGHALIANMVHAEFTGPIYPVNPHHKTVFSLPSYGSVTEIPGEVDLAVIAVPAARVLEVVRQCAAKHVHVLLIISAGFAEVGPKGHALQDEVVELARRHGMRLVGPNCLGVLNTEDDVRLNANFAPTWPPAGHVGLSSQSGALGIAILNLAKELRLGISQFIGVGNKADVSGNDLLYFWGQDPNTRVILLYLESFGNPRKFSRIARRVGREKPIVVLKSGTSQAGIRAASSHTGALASSSVAAETLMEQAGIVQTYTMEQFFNAAKVLGNQPLPAGRRVGILTNAGGPGILSADRAEAEGLSVPPVSEELQKKLKRHLPPAAGTSNPVDMIASATPEQYEACLELMLASDEFDMVLVLFIPPLVTRTQDVARAICRARRAVGPTKPLVSCLLGVDRADPVQDELEAAGVTTFPFPEEAMLSLAQLCQYGEWRRKDPGRIVHFSDVKVEEARNLIVASVGEDPTAEPRWLEPEDTFRLLASYGLPVLPTRFAHDANEAAQHAEALGFPVAMKLASETILHKSDVKGVLLNLRSAREVRGAFLEMADNLERIGRRDEMAGVILQPMAAGGLEAVLGVHSDPRFGPVMMAGLGGVYLELFRDVQFSLHPVTDLDVDEMCANLRSAQIFKGYRGEPPRDLAAFKEALLRLSQLVDDHPQIKEVDLNPMMVMSEGQGCKVVDARIRVAAVDPYTEFVISQLNE